MSRETIKHAYGLPSRLLVGTAGLGMAATGAWIGASHAPTPDMALFIWALAAGCAVGSAYLTRMGWLAIPAVLSIVAAETYNSVNAVERMLALREQAQIEARSEGQARDAAAHAVATEEAALAKAEAAVAAEIARGGCGRVCKDLKAAAEAARERLRAAREAAVRVRPARSESPLAEALGVRAVDVSIAHALIGVIAALLGPALLAAAHAPARGGEGRDAVEARVREEVRAEMERTARRQAAAAKGRATRAANKAAAAATKAALARAQAAARKAKAANDNAPVP